MTSERLPLYYTFGNHMHWTDMEWLWGYFVLPSSLRDMLHLCRETGARGNLNFDAVGYEKLAVEAPEALDELRCALAAGTLEIVGASYGQPYGLFHGGESNVRQRAYGVRTVLRLLGVRPRTFWEEEFDFFPQLPQILCGAGYEHASLFFQWTWHTPSLPQEQLPAIWWEGQDGSRLLAAPRNALNLHQWPEDFAGLLESPLLREMPTPGIVQWLELLPSPDWRCRSELLLPQLRALLCHPRLELRCVTLSQYLELAREHAEPRRYTMDDVFHGVSLGKNGDRMRRLSRQGEQTLLAAEALSALGGLAGRPYPSWNVYPVWELEEAWRELLVAQHHDNDECEGLCGYVGRRSYERSLGLAGDVLERTLRHLASRAAGAPGRTVVFNPLGWSRDALVPAVDGASVLVRDIPPFGYVVVDTARPQHDDAHGPNARRAPWCAPLEPVEVIETSATIVLRRGHLCVTLDRERGLISQITSAEFPEGLLHPDRPLLELELVREGRRERFSWAQLEVTGPIWRPEIRVRRWSAEGAEITITVALATELDAVDLRYASAELPRPDGRMHAALQTSIAPALTTAGAEVRATGAPGAEAYRLIHDHPYGLSEVEARGSYLRKYPTGDWMTSPQVFEEVQRPFTALQLIDIVAGERGLLYLHDGSQAFFRTDDGVRQILSLYDPWDEGYYDARLDARVRLVPHGPLDHARRWRLAQEFTRPALSVQSERPGGDLPRRLGALWCDAPGVAVCALFRESEEAGARLERYAGAGMGHPFVARLVELNGAEATARLLVPGEVAAAWRTNLLGEPVEQLGARSTLSPLHEPGAPLAPGATGGLGWSEISLQLRPYEIATIYLDLVMGRKQPRNLDDYRSVWATVHRVV